LAVQERLLAIQEREKRCSERQKELEKENRGHIRRAAEERRHLIAESKAEAQRSTAEIKRLRLRLESFETLPEDLSVPSDVLCSQEFASERKALVLAFTDHYALQLRIKSDPAVQNTEMLTRESLWAISAAAEQLDKAATHAHMNLPKPNRRVRPSTAVSRPVRRPRSGITVSSAVVSVHQPLTTQASAATAQPIQAISRSVSTATTDQSTQTGNFIHLHGWQFPSLAESCLPARVTVPEPVAPQKARPAHVAAVLAAAANTVVPTPPPVDPPTVKVVWSSSKVFSYLSTACSWGIVFPLLVMIMLLCGEFSSNPEVRSMADVDALADSVPGSFPGLARFLAPPGPRYEPINATKVFLNKTCVPFVKGIAPTLILLGVSAAFWYVTDEMGW
jgi:hypothetical protein